MISHEEPSRLPIFLWRSPGAGSTWLEDPTLAQLALQEKLTVAQLLLNWAVSQGVAVIPSARSRTLLT